jgi:energy-converting hydrogenase Eha subunit A
MFSTRAILLAAAVGVVLACLLVVLIGTQIAVAAFTGLAAGVVTAILPWAIRDGRFPGPRSGVHAYRAIRAGYAVILCSAVIGLADLDVDRTTRFSLQLLVLAVGVAGLMLGSAAVLLDTNRHPSVSDE